MKQIWFAPGVEHRGTGPRTLWAKKPLHLQVAIILAANRHRGDYWELLLPEARERYLEKAEALIAEGGCIARQGRLERGRVLRGVYHPGSEEASLALAPDGQEAA